MPDEPEEPTGDGEVIEPATPYTPEVLEPEEQPTPSVPFPTDGGSIFDGPQYPAPGEVTE
ncbi:hypothetical protein [Streptomyces sp. NPDC005302]|uniref:hypothetical protein n=1 Tax=Streptomyces sp. NPDC005302 TaxID=3154675 RepID=UPI0033BF7696